MPDVNRLPELSRIFNVTIDYLLMPSEVDELTIRTETIEKKHEYLQAEFQKKQVRNQVNLKITKRYFNDYANIKDGKI